MPKLKIAILISGRGSNMSALIKACADASYPAEIVLVLSNKPAAAGLAIAAEAGLNTIALDHKAYDGREAFEQAMIAAIDGSGAELVVLAGFMRLLTPLFVDHYHDRLINIHPSLLPAFPGLHTHERALADGVRFAGCTVHFVRAEMDAGPIIAQAAVPVLDNDDAESLAARVLEQEHLIYPAAVRWIAEGRVTIEGNRTRISGTLAPDARIHPYSA